MQPLCACVLTMGRLGDAPASLDARAKILPLLAAAVPLAPSAIGSHATRCQPTAGVMASEHAVVRVLR